MGRDRRAPYARVFHELEAIAPPAATNAITEEDLVRGYSGLVDRRHFPLVSAETVRARLAAAYGIAAAGGAASRDEVVAPADEAAEATP